MPLETVVSSPFATVSDCIRQTARLFPAHSALIQDGTVLGYGDLESSE